MAVDAIARIEGLVAPTLADMGFAVVRLRLGGQPPVLQVMVERADGSEVTISDCAAVSRALSALLDVDDPIAGRYTLEVSSPGIDRPLTRPNDYTRFAGLDVQIELAEPLDGRRRFRGRLLGRDGDKVRLMQDGSEVTLALDAIAAAKLVLSDELLARDLKQRDGRATRESHGSRH